MRDEFLRFRDSALELFNDVEKTYLAIVQIHRTECESEYEKEMAGYERARVEYEKRLTPHSPSIPLPPFTEAHFYVDFSKFLDQRLTDEQRKESERLRVEAKQMISHIASALHSCPLLTEADFRDFSVYGKTIVAAVQFRELSSWESKPIYDESNNILFVEPAGQEERKVGSLKALRSAFGSACERVLHLLEYLSSQDGPAFQTSRLLPVNTVPSYRPNTAFIMMRIDPEDPSNEDLVERIERIFKSFDIKANRIDRISHEGPITDRILEEIMTSEFLFADLTGERPSVYYEVGFAHALKKRVMLFRQKGCKITSIWRIIHALSTRT